MSTYVDPADRVASAKATADDIKTWSVSEIDKKGKKKKGAGFNPKTDVSFLPVSAFTGLNLKDRVPKSVCTWYE